MKVLVIGGGGREHALAWKLAQSPRVQMVYVAPGNAGTALDATLQNVAPEISADLEKLADFVAAEKIGLTVVGPEASLAAGAADLFAARGLRIFGPTQAAARLESSKAHAKAFMQRHRIPTAAYETFDDAATARAYVAARPAQVVDGRPAPVVVKADGLAAGKGVVVAMTHDEANAAIDAMLAIPGGRVVIEDFLEGEEASFMVVVSRGHALSLATSQDHKRIFDHDQGPNTGGMGAYSPAPVVTPNVHARVMHEIVQPTLAGLEADGVPYTGFLYVGLMIDKAGAPRVVEYNCRLGDPETQPILMRLKSDLFELLWQAADPAGKPVDTVELQWDRRVALGVVMAAADYPGEPKKGDRINGLFAGTPDLQVFHAGTAMRDGSVVTAGGRVLCVTALGDSTRLAQQRAYEGVARIQFAGAQYRRDIGSRAIKRG